MNFDAITPGGPFQEPEHVMVHGNKQTAGLDYHALNAMLHLYGEDGQIQFEKDREAAKQYFLQHVNQNTVFFHNLREKLDYLLTEGYY